MTLIAHSKRLIAATLIVAAAGSCQSAEEPPPSPPNLLLVTIDTLRADRLTGSRDGAPIMPNLQQFARENTWFPYAFSSGPWTRLSMASAFTSLNPVVHNVRSGRKDQYTEPLGLGIQLSPSIPNLATLLRELGYKTAAIQSNPQMTPQFGMDEGYDVFRYRPYRSAKPGGPSFDARSVTTESLRLFKDGELGATENEPFFLYAHYTDPHAPYEPPSEYLDRFPTAEPLTAEESAWITNANEHYRAHLEQWPHGGKPLDVPPRAFAEMLRRYDAEAAYVDDEVWRLVSEVRRRYPNTIVVLFSDHGEEFLEHGQIFHGFDLYDELLRVPFILSTPDGIQKVVESPVTLVDLVPTLAPLLNIAPDPAWQGRDLLDDASGPRTIISEVVPCKFGDPLRVLTLVDDEFKLIQTRILEGQRKMKWELYRWREDPANKHNLAEALPDTLKSLVMRLNQMDAQATENAYYGSAHGRSRGGNFEIPQELSDELESLGYLK